MYKWTDRQKTDIQILKAMVDSRLRPLTHDGLEQNLVGINGAISAVMLPGGTRV